MKYLFIYFFILNESSSFFFTTKIWSDGRLSKFPGFSLAFLRWYLLHFRAPNGQEFIASPRF